MLSPFAESLVTLRSEDIAFRDFIIPLGLRVFHPWSDPSGMFQLKPFWFRPNYGSYGPQQPIAASGEPSGVDDWLCALIPVFLIVARLVLRAMTRGPRVKRDSLSGRRRY
jgi:hypothetical protein